MFGGVQQGCRCGLGVGFQIPDIKDFVPKTMVTALNPETDWLVAEQARQSVAKPGDWRTTCTS